MSTQTSSSRPVFSSEQKAAWLKAKALLKDMSLKIRALRADKEPRGYYSEMFKLSYRYRALHTAMSLLRGKTMEQIEAIPTKPGKAEQRRMTLCYCSMEKRVQTWVDHLKDPGATKLYVYVDANLSDSQKAVQSAHAVAQFQKDHPTAPWVNGTLVLMTLDPNAPGERWNRPAKFEDFTTGTNSDDFTSVWREPDMDNRITAVARLSTYNNEQNGKIPGTKLL